MLLPFLAIALQTMTLQPSDDIWVYPHASDPAGDNFMRIWGVDRKAAPKTAADAEAFSMGYLKFSLIGTPATGKLKEARLILTQIGKPGFTLEQAKEMPLEARALAPDFDEPTWKADSIEKLLPPFDKEAFYGSGYPASLEGDTLTISIDLLKGKSSFAEALAKAQLDPKRQIAIALTSSMDMAELGRGNIYKIYTREEKDEKLRPRLMLLFG